MGAERADPFALDDLSDFAPKPEAKRRPATDAKAVREVAEQQGFRSREQRKEVSEPPAAPVRQAERQPSDRLYQLNLKLRKSTYERFKKLKKEHDLLYGDLLDQAMDALEAKGKSR